MGKRVTRSILMGLLTVCMTVSIAACGNKPSSGSPTPQSSGGAATGTATPEVKAPEVEKPKSITWFANIGLKEEYGFQEWNDEFERLTGIKMEHPHIIGNEYYQKLELSFTSNTMPDVFVVGITDGKLPLYVSQGAVLDLTDRIANSTVLDIPEAVLESTRINGKLYGVPFEDNSGTVTYIRKDWLDKANLSVPTNYDEFLTMLRAFKNIQDGAIPFTSPGLYADQAEIYLREFYQDASPEFIQDANGQWVDGMLQESMVKALSRLQSAYAEGLIDMEVVTNKTSTCREKWYAGNVGVFNYWAGDWNINMEDRVKDNNPDAVVVPISAIAETNYLKRVPVVMSISSQAKNPDGIFKYFIEYANDKAEGSVLFQHGVENLHWKQEGENIVHLAPAAAPTEVLAKAFISPVVGIAKITGANTAYNVDERVNNSLGILDADGSQLVGRPLSKTLSKVNADLVALRDKTISSITLGIKSVDEGLAEYKTEVEKLGLASILEELNSGK